MFTGLSTPGSRSSEFLVTILNVLVQIVLAWTDTIGTATATKLGVLGTIAYAISRGLAKYEGRGTTPPQPPAPPVA